MDFLKISGLVLGTISVSGVGAVGIYYLDSRNIKNTSISHETDLDSAEIATDNEEVDETENDERPSTLLSSMPIAIDESDVDAGETANINRGSNNVQIPIIQPTKNQNIQFDGKLVFLKKRENGKNITYEAKLITTSQYNIQKEKFDKNKSDQDKYEQVHKIIDISNKLNFSREKTKLKNIFKTPSSTSDIKNKILSEATELKKLLGSEIYENLKNKFNS